MAQRKSRCFLSGLLAPLAGLCGALLLLASCTTSRLQPLREADYPRPIRVACVGDSITFGLGIPDRERASYPAQLQALLGQHWEVRNCGFSGATLVKGGTKPYSLLPVYGEALAFKPDVVIIQLGTNDTNEKTWPAHGAEFVADYLELVRSFQALPTRPRVYLCLPVPLFRDRGKAYDTDRVLVQEVIPKIRQVARQAHTPVIDLYAALADNSDLFPDGVHPNARGAQMMAAAIDASLVGRPAR